MQRRYLLIICLALSIIAMLGIGDSGLAKAVHAFPGLTGSAIGAMVAGICSAMRIA